MRWCLAVSSILVSGVLSDSRRVRNNPNSWLAHKPASTLVANREAEALRDTRDTNFANQNSYDSPSEPSEPIDLHNKEFCVDVSTYQPVVWVERDAEACETVFVKQCEDRSEQVCAEVTETKCEVVPYKECKSGQVPQQFSETKLTPKKFVEQACTSGKKEIPHTKLLPECKNVTKQNCVTLWETDANGKQVWAGTDACEPVTWQECKLVPKNVKFIVPEITCNPRQELWYHEPEAVTETRMTNTFGCEVKSTTHCTTQQRPDCKTVSWEECKEVPVVNCNPKSVHVPTQELLHRKKCLLADEGADTGYTGYGAPESAPLPSYGAPAPAPAAPVYTPAPQPTYSG